MACSDPMLGSAELGVFTFFASTHPGEVCGSNGLPLTPNSIKILGRSQHLKTVIHPHLCTYVDIIRGKHEQLKVVSEYYSLDLKTAVKHLKFRDVNEIVRLAYELLQGLAFLNDHNIVCRNVCPENILFTFEGKAKLFNYGMYFVTDGGRDVTFPIGHPKYLPPEVYLMGDKNSPENPSNSPNVDVWSLGLIVVELVFGKELWEDLRVLQLVRKTLSLIHCDGQILERLAQEHNCLQIVQTIPSSLKDFLETCLTLLPAKRPRPKELLRHQLFQEFKLKPTVSSRIPRPSFPSMESRCKSCEIPVMGNVCPVQEIWMENYPGLKRKRETWNEEEWFTDSDHLAQRSMKEVYYLWQLAGGDVETILKKQGLIRYKPPILSIPKMMLIEGKTFGCKKDRALLLDSTVVVLPLDELRKRLKHIPPESYYPLTEQETTDEPESTHSDLSLPLVIREKDIEYQFHRIVLYERLLRGYPFKKSSIWKEAHQDIPPLYRAHIWASLLEIKGDVRGCYESIDKETPSPTDRQIEVDIPRCHQYDELLSSPMGHLKFKRVLKAWVVSNPQYVYWQGLDSLCAPFLYLNFEDEALAYACLSAFIPKYLYNFFLKDNSAVIQEYLVTFSHVITFHDPELTNHLDEIGFIPELYAIPWFLTMFSHVFPLHKIFHLWDKLLLGDSSFPLCVGLAILMQLRDTLLSSGFNECILLFSDMPEVDIERCVKDSVDIFCSTPKSVMYRQHELPAKKKKSKKDRKTTAELGMDPIPLVDLKAEKCPRISAEDLLDLLDLQRSKYNKSKIVVVDMRPSEEYNRGTIPTSINIPLSQILSPDGESNPSSDLSLLSGSKGKIIAVVGGKGGQAAQFAAELVKRGFSRVCTLHKGIDILRPTDILAVPSWM